MDRKPNAILNDISATLSGTHDKPLVLSAAASSEVRKEFESSASPATVAAYDVQDKVAGMAGRAGDTVSRAVDGVRRSTGEALDAAGGKVRDVRGRCAAAASALADRIDADPKRAVTYAAVGGAVLTAALIGLFRRR